jgi:hypothetical protein
MTARLDGVPAAELRALIRDVLRDVLPAAAPGDGTPPSRDGTPPSGDGTPPSGVSSPPTVSTPQAANGRPTAPPSGLPAGQPSGQPPASGQQSGATPQPAGSVAKQDSSAATPRASATEPSARQTVAGDAARSRQVRLETDDDLRQFALDIVRLADNPARRRDLLAGRLTFTLARRAPDAAAPDDHRIESGAVTERAVQSAAKAGRRLVLGPRAVLTPLARDRALALGVPIERER